MIPQDHLYRTIGIDPGTNCCGFSVIDKNIITGEIYIPQVTTVYKKDLLSINHSFITLYGERQAVIALYGNYFSMLIQAMQPNAVVCESPFFRRGNISAFRALTEQLTTFRNTVFNWDFTVPFITVDPPSAKRAVDATEISKNKDPVKDGVRALCFNYHPLIHFESLDEHSIDSIAVAYSHVKNIKLNIPPY